MKHWGMLLLVALAGCGRPDASVCGSLAMRLPDGLKNDNVINQRQSNYSCVERWAARLARSKQDTATEVAAAVIDACRDGIDNLGRLQDSQLHVRDREAEYAIWREHALFIAVQTRAGRCYPDA